MTNVYLDVVRDNFKRVRQRVDQACVACNREPASVRLLPVSKTVPAERLRRMPELGMRQLGENKVQEAQEKSELLADTGLQWVLIGHLQTNKAKYAAEFASEFQALDSLKLAQKLDAKLQQLGRSLDVLVQVNTSGEDSKFGLKPEEVAAFVQELPAFHSLKVRGLMTLAQFSNDKAVVTPCFVRLRELQQQLRQDSPAGQCWDELSMGMSGDFEWAIEQGATTVRVGQAIFGPRNTPDSQYWPEAVASGA